MNSVIQTDYVLEITEGDVAFVQSLFDEFKSSTPQMLQELIYSAQDKKNESVEKILHKLKSTYIVFGITCLTDSLDLFSKRPIVQEDLQAILQSVDKINERFNISLHEITIFIEELSKL